MKARFKHDKGEGESEQRPDQSASQAQASAGVAFMHASTAVVGREGGAWGVGEGVGRRTIDRSLLDFLAAAVGVLDELVVAARGCKIAI